jgi:hypothetical protein
LFSKETDPASVELGLAPPCGVAGGELYPFPQGPIPHRGLAKFVA